MLLVRGAASCSLAISSYSCFNVWRMAIFGSFISRAITVFTCDWMATIFCKVRTLFVTLILLKKAGF